MILDYLVGPLASSKEIGWGPWALPKNLKRGFEKNKMRIFN